MKHALLFLTLIFSTAVLAEVPQMLDVKGFRGGIAKIGDLYIAGQPMSEKVLENLKSEGVTTVINLRIEQEMNNPKSTPIDEAKVLDKLDMKYIHVPSGGEKHPFSPATLDKFATALDKSEGKVLLHCNSARRATHIWVAYLVKYKNVPLDEALKLGRAINFGATPIEGYLEGEIDFSYNKED
jgi:uncharacterized protein (TIGR01244 family)